MCTDRSLKFLLALASIVNLGSFLTGTHSHILVFSTKTSAGSELGPALQQGDGEGVVREGSH